MRSPACRSYMRADVDALRADARPLGVVDAVGPLVGAHHFDAAAQRAGLERP